MISRELPVIDRPSAPIPSTPQRTPLEDNHPISFPATNAPQVSFLIPTTTQRAHLESCLVALRDGMYPRTPYEVIIVLNGATDEVKNFVRSNIQGACILESPVNRGLPGGYNLARPTARGKFLALIHDDTEIAPGWAERLIETLESDKFLGAAGSLILLPDGTPLSAGSVLWNDGRTCPSFTSDLPMPETFRALRPVDYCGTCGIMVRQQLWDAIGGLDENLYPAYYVDVDLCMAVRQHGRIVVCDGRTEIKHHVGSSSTTHQRHFYSTHNRGYFVEKWKAELQTFEEPTSADPFALERADESSRRRADAIRRRAPVPLRAQPPPKPLPGWVYLEREAQTAKRFARHMEAEFATAETRTAELRRSATGLEAAVKSQAEEIARLKGHLEMLIQSQEDEKARLPMAMEELGTLKRQLRFDPAFLARKFVESGWRVIRRRLGGR